MQIHVIRNFYYLCHSNFIVVVLHLKFCLSFGKFYTRTYHYQNVCHLQTGNKVHRLPFCQWLLEQDKSLILFVQLCGPINFHRDRINNFYYVHACSLENSHAVIVPTFPQIFLENLDQDFLNWMGWGTNRMVHQHRLEEMWLGGSIINGRLSSSVSCEVLTEVYWVT